MSLLKFLKASQAPGSSNVEFSGGVRNEITDQLQGFRRSSLATDNRDARVIRKRQILGSATKDFDSKHAVLVVRESPRLGTVAQPSFARFLESVEQQARFPTGKIVFATDNFVLGYLGEQETERMVPVYNFGAPFVQTTSEHGRNPRMFNYGGALLINDTEGSAFDEFRRAWDKYLRLAVQVEDSRIVPLVCELTFRDQIRRGYLVRCDFNMQSQQPGIVQINLTMFIVHAASKGSLPPAAVQPVSTLSERISQENAPAIPDVIRVNKQAVIQGAADGTDT